MSDGAKVVWRLSGDQVGSCNCAWGCPCQFNALPTTGRCEAMVGRRIHKGHFGAVQLDGLRVAELLSWPGAVHQGNGTRQLVIDERAAPAQRQALLDVWSGKHGGLYFEIFAAVCPNHLPPLFASISVEGDQEARRASVRIEGIAQSRVEPIRNPVTGQEHRARINLPNGFEYSVAEMGNSVHWKVTAGGTLQMEHHNTYAQLNAFDFSNL